MLVTVTLAANGIRGAGTQTIVAKLTPYGVAANPQIADPLSWEYVVDLHHQSVTLNVHNGIVINLEKMAPTGYLRIKPIGDATPLPFINVANSVRGTVARIYTGGNVLSDASKVVGEYWSIPGGPGGNPSRTTVDRYGNVWVGNRNIGDVDGGSNTQFGFVIGGTRCNADGSPNPNGDFLKPPFIHNTCVDRNGDGLIHTSRGANLQLPWLNTMGEDTFGGVSTADDEAILSYLRVVPTGVRTIVIDANNNLWVASPSSPWNEFIDTVAAMQVTGFRLGWPGGGYGGVIGGDGAIWSSGYTSSSGLLLRFRPGSMMPVTSGGTIRNTVNNYGITVDPLTGDVWQALYPNAEVMEFRADHCTTRFLIGQSNNRGIAIDGRGSVWVGGSGSTVFHLTTAGAPVGSVPMSVTPPGQPSPITGSLPLGVVVDSHGKIWAVCYGTAASSQNGYAMRIDPSQGTIPPGSDRPVGQVVEAINLGPGSGPYNYSDMSGFVTLSTAQPSGVWNRVEDSGADHTLWSSLSMDAEIPAQTRIVVEVRAANKITDLPSWPFRPIVDAGGATPPGTTTLPGGIKGRYVEVRANLLRGFGVTASPELRSLTIQPGLAGCAINITVHPKSQAVLPGQTASFTVTAQVPQGATATYQWLKDGAEVAGATAATLTINDANYGDAARYSVMVGTVSGCTFQLESAPARLHVKGSPPTFSIAQDLPPSLSVAEGADGTLIAQASAGNNLGEMPIYYQWRFNNEPISGASGSCGVGNCIISRVVPGQCANAGFYSVVFWNQYGQIATRNCEFKIAGMNSVTVTPSTVSVASPNQVVTLTAATCLGGINCIQWYLTRGGVKTAIPGANSLSYTIPTPITCEHIGTYTVSVADSGWNAYEASATVSAPAAISSTTLKITPDNIGAGAWTYQWSYSDDQSTYSSIPGATADSYTPSQSRYYKGVATRSGATAEVSLYYQHGLSPNVQALTTQNSILSVTYTADPISSGPYHWYFTREGTFTEEDTGVTTSQYTVSPVDCTRRGRYRCAYGGCTQPLSASAILFVANPTVVMASPTLKINPDDVGTGMWMYQWSYSADGSTFNEISGATSDTYIASQQGLYKVVATRSGASAEILVDYHVLGQPIVIQHTTQNGTLSVTYAPQVSGVLGSGGWNYHWYFTHQNGGPQQDLGPTIGPYTISPVDCSKRGYYRVDVGDTCGADVDTLATSTLFVDNCP